MSLVERTKRVDLHLPVEVRGEDATGSPFTELTHCLNVSGGGILFESHRQGPGGARVSRRIELPVHIGMEVAFGYGPSRGILNFTHLTIRSFCCVSLAIRSRRVSRPRDSRDITVPTGTPSAVAASR